jgi:hypothetical protein
MDHTPICGNKAVESNRAGDVAPVVFMNVQESHGESQENLTAVWSYLLIAAAAGLPSDEKKPGLLAGFCIKVCTSNDTSPS